MAAENLIKLIGSACVIASEGIEIMQGGLGVDDIDNAIVLATELGKLVGIHWSEVGPEAIELFKDPAVQGAVKAAVIQSFDIPDDALEGKLEAIFIALLDMIGAVNAAYKAGLSVYNLAKQLKE